MRFSRFFLIAFIAVAALFSPSLASADGITWTLNNVNLNDGAILIGAFNYDAATNTYSAIDLASSSGTLNGMTYTTLTPEFFSTTTLLGVGPTTIPGGNFAGLSFLQLFFTNPLTNSGGTDPVYTVETYCANANCSSQTQRVSIIGGTVTGSVATPEPASLLILACGLLAVFILRRLA